jgi:hypothetical protein
LRTSGGCIDRRRRPIAMPINGKPTTITTITAMLVAVPDIAHRPCRD